MKVVLKKIVIIFGFLILLVLLLNWQFVFLNLKHSLRPHSLKPEILLSEKDKILSNSLLIPTLGIEAPVVYVDAVNENLFQSALRYGVVHYPNTAKFGETGNSYIFGHSSDLKVSPGEYKTVFALLPRIELGAKIIVSSESGQIFTYEVKEKFIASSQDTYLLSQDTEDKKILTLQTSWPLGTALKRYIVRAELLE